MSALVHHKFKGEELGLEFLEHQGGLAKGTLKGIFNAWIAASVIDQRGGVWVKASKLHTILRMKKDRARYLLGGADKRDKVQMTGEGVMGGEKVLETLVRSSKVCEWVDHSIQSPVTSRTADYLKYSEAIYRKVRDCDRAKLLRAEFHQQLKSTQRNLKKLRVKRLKLKHDELTGEALEKSANFAHIRAACHFFEIADKDWNGVVINEGTHLLLTKKGIFDEGELLHFCEKKKWKTDWHGAFKRELRVFEGVGAAA
jgi:hypothetical protein